MVNGIGGTTGPDLTKVGSRRDRTWLIGHFKEPRNFVPNSAMPPVTASDADLEQLTAYMLTLK
jgi:cbb3-type cytochrome oxidase cytochrome c subunit